MKFNVGDKVVLREGLVGGDYYGGIYFNTKMNAVKGKVTTISTVRQDNQYLLEDGGMYVFTSEMLLPYPTKKFKVGDIVVGITDDYGFTHTGSICKVVKYSEYGSLIVKVLNHEQVGCSVGAEFPVDENKFKLKEDKVEVVEMVEFKVGDIITGKADASYSYTNSKMTRGEVVRVYDDGDIEVKILEHTKYPTQIGREWSVSPEQFVLVERKVDEVEVELSVKEALGVTFFKVGRYTLCVEGAFGVSLRHPEDTEVEEIGEALAFKRMVEHKKF